MLWGDGSFALQPGGIRHLRSPRPADSRVIGNDAAWMQIAREQVPILGDDVACMLAPSDYERAVEGLGARGFALRQGDDLAASLAAARGAIAAGSPALVNAHIGRSEFRKGSLSM